MENSNRKIAFRAWVKEKKIMVPISGLLFDNDRLCEILGNFLDGWGSSDTESVELMQFTGLKDKNGKEIYEGDILLNEYVGGGEPYAVKINPNWWYHEVEYGLIDDNNSHSFEVIANIYENPELIK